MEAPNSQAIPVGYQLQDYEIRKVLSAGGFSFVYIAHDKDKKLSPSKEYLPITLARNGEISRAIFKSKRQKKQIGSLKRCRAFGRHYDHHEPGRSSANHA